MNRRTVLIATGLGLLFSACGGMTLHEPSNGATINTATVNVRATWTDIQGAPDFALDGVDVTNQFTINTTTEEATATLPVSPGSRTISFGANSYCSYCNPKYQRRVLTSTFTVSGPSITLAVTPTSVEVPRGGSTTVTANITRSPTVSSAVAMAVSVIPGVTVTAPSIAAAPATSSTITLNAAAGAPLGNTTATVTATGPGGMPTATRPLSVRVRPRLGNFTEVPATISSAGMTTPSPLGTHRVRTELGSAVGSNHAFAATFETMSGQRRGVAYFYQGGPGFCAGDSAGVVITNNAAAFGHSSSHVYFIAYFPRNTVIDRPAQTAGGGNSVVQPRIFFSPDCTVAIIAHGNVAGTAPYVVRAIDLVTGADFGQSIEANTITAASLAKIVFLNGQVQVEIVTDLGTRRSPIP